jgi:uncharacterized protein YciI
MRTNKGFVRAPLAIGIALALGIAAFVVAQDSATVQQTTSSKTGQASATASSSARAQAGSASTRSTGSQLGGATIGGFDPNKRLYAVWYTDTRQNRPNQRQDVEAGMHYKYMKGLSLQGTLIADGPFGDGTGMLTVIQAPDDQAALQLVQSDPVVQDKAFTVTLKQWTVVQGQWVGGDMIGRPTPARTSGAAGAPGAAGGGG